MEETYVWVREPAMPDKFACGEGMPFQAVTGVEVDEIDIVPTYLYNAVIQHFARTRIIGRVVPCPGCDWPDCVDCNPELTDHELDTSHHPCHPEWLQPIDADAVNRGISELEARLRG